MARSSTTTGCAGKRQNGSWLVGRSGMVLVTAPALAALWCTGAFAAQGPRPEPAPPGGGGLQPEPVKTTPPPPSKPQTTAASGSASSSGVTRTTVPGRATATPFAPHAAA